MSGKFTLTNERQIKFPVKFPAIYGIWGNMVAIHQYKNCTGILLVIACACVYEYFCRELAAFKLLLRYSHDTCYGELFYYSVGVGRQIPGRPRCSVI